MKKKYLSFFFLVAVDGCTLLLSFYLAFLIRRDLLPHIFPSLLARPVLFSIFLNRFYMIILWLAVFGSEKLYTKRHTFGEEIRLLIKGSTFSFALILAILFVFRGFFFFSRAIIFLTWLVSLILLPAFRRLSKLALYRAKIWKKKVIIIGSTDSTDSVIRAISQNKILGYEIVGCLTDDPKKIGMTVAGVPILGHFDEIEAWKETTAFEDIIVTFPNIPRDRLINLLKRWDSVSETIRYIPQTGDLITTGIEIENIGNILSLAVRKNLHKPWNILVKTLFEFLLAFVTLVCLTPLFFLIAVAVKLDSPGPVFFRQERFGRRGKAIRIVKFRTMYLDTDRRLGDYLRNNAEARREWATFKKLKNHDPRVTRVGALLRKYSLDELPQLANVLGGDMNIVGPRPYIREELAEAIQVKSVLFQVRPGITGLWQISGRSNVPFEERLRLDEHYIRNWSLWSDLVILVKTLRVAASGSGAF